MRASGSSSFSATRSSMVTSQRWKPASESTQRANRDQDRISAAAADHPDNQTDPPPPPAHPPPQPTVQCPPPPPGPSPTKTRPPHPRPRPPRPAAGPHTATRQLRSGAPSGSPKTGKSTCIRTSAPGAS
jgi:hypothetical protein